jgi:AcrR family transcriptional regulator
VPRVTASRLGRPPGSSSAATRRRILDVARQSFAEFGYGGTTNRHIAAEVGITTGALYHYFDSKLDLYLAVQQYVDEVAFGRLRTALAAHESFAGQLRAVLDESHRINLEDPSIAQFLGAARVDVGRHDDLAAALRGRHNQGRALLQLMVDRGVATGEIDAADREVAGALLRTVFAGLVDAASSRPVEQRRAMDGLIALVEGGLVRRPRRRSARAS